MVKTIFKWLMEIIDQERNLAKNKICVLIEKYFLKIETHK